MYLKRLELHGFKTFAPRTVLDFERGVTAVVGPNGSGKSNLADAVRWALGEQNVRNVRCRQAEDLIFAGTAAGHGVRNGARAPMGMAEVLLTFDNSAGWLPVDFHEVRIGRRAYRGGENEYLLNGARVRLRDITDLLSRASVSASGHLIIGQGLVDTVLALRAEERRGLVENLAGLRFYYSRRDDAEAKLRATEANLRNVDAMIAEAGPHLALLQEQAVAYARYHEVEQELRALLLQHYANAYAQAVERRAQRVAEAAAAEQALQAVSAAVQEGECALAALRERSRALGQQAGALRAEVRAAHGAREAAERDLAVSRARREAAGVRLDDLRGGLEPLESRRAEAAKELAYADTAAREIEAERAALQEAHAAHERCFEEAARAVSAAERAVRAVAERRRALEKAETTTTAELDALGREDEAGKDQDGRLAVDEQAAIEEADAAVAVERAAHAALAQAGTRIEAARAAEAQARALATATVERARVAAAARRDTARQVEESAARAAGLRAWLAAVAGGTAEGGQDGAASVAVALVATPESERALAAALGPLLTAQAVTMQATAATASALLAGGARGVLTAGRVWLRRTEQQGLEERLAATGLASDAVVGWGDALARVDADVAGVSALRDALSAVLVVRDLEQAWGTHAILATLSETTARLVVLATPAGEALLPSGLLHRPGDEGAAALERGRELRLVEREVAERRAALQEAEVTEREAAEASTRAATTAEQALRTLRAAEQERNARQGEVTATGRALAQARREAEWAVERRQRWTAAATARAGRRRQLEEQLAITCANLAALAAEEAPARAQFEAARIAQQEATQRRAEHSAATGLVDGRAGDAARRRRAAEEALVRLDDDLRARREALTRLERDVVALSQGEEALAARVGAEATRLRTLHERLRPLDAELTTMEEQIRGHETHLAGLRPQESQAAAGRQGAALALQRAEHEVENVTAGLQADLGREPVDLPLLEPPAPGLQGRVRTLRGQLSAFGPVNARAPEDYAATTERQEFLQAQAGDLREGMARLRTLIAEANATVRERFGSVAGELDAQFRVYLQRLFGGGKGELTALYDEAGLPSGLEIAVQPPGKRTSELALLSGGERALVGLALVFAMLAVRPVPFCVLDEAEAALDEANTLRVGEILRSLSTRTQFIVITHNRGTMSHADALYGVTMAESGVSQVASLRLDEVEAVRRSRAG